MMNNPSLYALAEKYNCVVCITFLLLTSVSIHNKAKNFQFSCILLLLALHRTRYTDGELQTIFQLSIECHFLVLITGLKGQLNVDK